MSSLFRTDVLLAAVVIAAMSQLPHSRAQEAKALQLTGDYAGTHDPSIGREGSKYYVFRYRPCSGRRAVCDPLLKQPDRLETMRSRL